MIACTAATPKMLATRKRHTASAFPQPRRHKARSANAVSTMRRRYGAGRASLIAAAGRRMLLPAIASAEGVLQ